MLWSIHFTAKGCGGKIVTDDVFGAFTWIVRVARAGASVTTCCGHSGIEATIDAGGVLASDGVAVLQALDTGAGELTVTQPAGVKNARALSCAIAGSDCGRLAVTPITVFLGKVFVFWDTRTLDKFIVFAWKPPT